MSAMASQITSLTIVYSTVCSVADQRKHQSSASLVFVRGIRRWRVNSPHNGPVTRKLFPFDDVIVTKRCSYFAVLLMRDLWMMRLSATLNKVLWILISSQYMMTSSNGNIFRVTGPLYVEFTGHRWIPHTKASDAELWCFLWSAPG